MDETVLIQKSQQGDMDAFEQLVLLYEKKVYTIAYKYMGNHEDASDMAQEALIKAYQSIGSFRGEAAFGTWLGGLPPISVWMCCESGSECRLPLWMMKWSWKKAV